MTGCTHCYCVMCAEVHGSCHGCTEREKRREMNVEIMGGGGNKGRKKQTALTCKLNN
jgi:hypothetical protein